MANHEYFFTSPTHKRIQPSTVTMTVPVPEELPDGDKVLYGRLVRQFNHNRFGCGWSRDTITRGYEAVIARFRQEYGVDIYEMALMAGAAPDADEESSTYFW